MAVRDTFVEAGSGNVELSAHTPSGGGTWAFSTTGTGRLSVMGTSETQGRARCTTTGTYDYHYSAQPAADCAVRMDLIQKSATGTAGVMARTNYTGGVFDILNLNCYWFGYLAGTTRWNLTRYDNASGTVLSAKTGISLTNDQVYSIALVCIGSIILGVVDGEIVCAAEDATYASAGYAGINGNASATSATTHFQFDNFETYDVGSRVATNDSKIIANSDRVWLRDASTARCTVAGNRLYLKVTAGAGGLEDVFVTVNEARLNGLTNDSGYTVAVKLDGQTVMLARQGASGAARFYHHYGPHANRTGTLNKSGLAPGWKLAAGDHVIEIVVRSQYEVSGTTLGSWGTGGSVPAGAVEILGFYGSPGVTFGTPAAGTDYPSTKALVIGDSVGGTGVLAAVQPGDTTTTTASAANNDNRQHWFESLCERHTWLPVYLGKGGIGYQQQNGTFQTGDTTANPPIIVANGASETWLSHLWNGQARTWVADEFSYCAIQAGANDGGSLTTTHVTDTLAYLRTNLGASCWLLQVMDPGRRAQATITTALATPQDSKTALIDPYTATALYSTTTAGLLSPDGSHANGLGHRRHADAIDRALVTAGVISSGGGGGQRLVRRGRFGLL